MSFMERQIVFGDWLETLLKPTGETVYLPLKDWLYHERPDEDEVEFRSTHFDKYGARLSAPGYLDCTEWCIFDTKEEAQAYLDETYPDDEDEDED
jgi:hypothetical protein